MTTPKPDANAVLRSAVDGMRRTIEDTGSLPASEALFLCRMVELMMAEGANVQDAPVTAVQAKGAGKPMGRSIGGV